MAHHRGDALILAKILVLLGLSAALYTVAREGPLSHLSGRVRETEAGSSRPGALPGQLRGPTPLAPHLTESDWRRSASQLWASLGRAHSDAGRYAEAVPQYTEARKLATALGKGGELVEIQGGLGAAYLGQGRLGQAKLELEAAFLVADKEGPQESWLLHMLGNTVRNLGKAEKALPLYARATKLPQDETRGGLASLLNDVGRAHLLQGELDEAMAHFQEAARQAAATGRAAAPQAEGAAASQKALARSYIGLVLHTRGDAAAALEAYRQALGTQEQLLPVEHPDMVATREFIGRAQRDLGRRGEALQTIAEAEKGIGSRRDMPELASLLRFKGDLLRETGKPAEGEAAVRQALSIQRACLGEQNTLDISVTLNILASCIQDQHRYTDAMAIYQQALQASMESVGEDSPDSAAAHNNLGSLYQDMGDDRKAAQEFTKTLEIQLKTLGSSNPDVSASYNNLAMELVRQGQVEKAEHLLAKAIAVTDRAKVNSHNPDREVYVHNHDVVLEELRKRSQRAKKGAAPAPTLVAASPGVV